eukprot:Awhi_evm1s7057
MRSGSTGLNEKKGGQYGKLEERMRGFEDIRDVVLYTVEKDVASVKKWTESSVLEKCMILLKDYSIEEVREKDNSENEKEFVKDVNESENVKHDDR